MAAAALPWLNVAVTAIPEVAGLIKALLALRTKYPTLTSDQIVAIVTQVTSQTDPNYQAALAEIATDQKPPAA